jgi:hypothetical protein
MRRFETNRAVWLARQGRSTVLGTLIVLAVCGCTEPCDRRCQSTQPPSSKDGIQSADLVEFRAEVISVIPIDGYSGTLRPVSIDPRFAVTVCLLDDVPELLRRCSETMCLGLHSPTLTFGTNEVVGHTFRFRIFGNAQGYYHVEAERDSRGGRVPTRADPAARVFHLPGMDVVKLAERLRLTIAADESGGGAIVLVADREDENIRVSRATPAQLRIIDDMITEWRASSVIVDPDFNFISLRHVQAEQAAARLAEFLQSEDGFEQATLTCDVRTNRLIIVGADAEHMQTIEDYAAELDSP